MNPNHATPQADLADSAAPITQAALNAARDAGGLATQEATRIGELARHWWQRNASSALDAASHVRHDAVAIADRSVRYVRDEPVRSMLAATAAGALIAGLVMLWFGRRGPR